MKKQILPYTTLFLLPILFLLGCGSSNNNGSQDGPPGSYQPVAVGAASSDIISAAQTGLPLFINAVKDRWADFGFASSGEPTQAELGTPYQICVLSNPGKAYQAINSTDEWYFPVLVNGAYRCILTVAKLNDQWQAVSLGAAGFAAALQETEITHPSLNFADRGIVKVYGFSSYPYEILGINLSGTNPSFLLLPPATELVTKLPQYSTWVSTDPIPVLSYEEMTAIIVSL